MSSTRRHRQKKYLTLDTFRHGAWRVFVTIPTALSLTLSACGGGGGGGSGADPVKPSEPPTTTPPATSAALPSITRALSVPSYKSAQDLTDRSAYAEAMLVSDVTQPFNVPLATYLNVLLTDSESTQRALPDKAAAQAAVTRALADFERKTARSAGNAYELHAQAVASLVTAFQTVDSRAAAAGVTAYDQLLGTPGLQAKSNLEASVRTDGGVAQWDILSGLRARCSASQAAADLCSAALQSTGVSVTATQATLCADGKCATKPAAQITAAALETQVTATMSKAAAAVSEQLAEKSTTPATNEQEIKKSEDGRRAEATLKFLANEGKFFGVLDEKRADDLMKIGKGLRDAIDAAKTFNNLRKQLGDIDFDQATKWSAIIKGVIWGDENAKFEEAQSAYKIIKGLWTAGSSLFSAVGVVFSVFQGLSSSSASQQQAQQFEILRQMLTSLSSQMSTEFSQVHKELADVHSAITTGFGAITNQLGDLADRQRVVGSAVAQISQTLDRNAYLAQVYQGDTIRAGVLTSIKGLLDPNITESQWRDDLNAIVTHGTSTAANTVFAGPSSLLPNDPFADLLNAQPGAFVNPLVVLPSARYAMSPLSGGRFASPVEVVWAAKTFATLVALFPAFADKNRTYVASLADQLNSKSLQPLLTLRNVAQKRGDFFDALALDYKTQIQAVQTEVDAVATRYLRTAGPTGLPVSGNPWLGPDQPSSYQPDVLASTASMTACSGAGPVLAAPTGMRETLPSNANSALHLAQLGGGVLGLCYESVNPGAGGYESSDHYKIDGGKYPLFVVLRLRVNVTLTVNGSTIVVASREARFPETGQSWGPSGPDAPGSGLCILSTKDRTGSYVSRYPWDTYLLAQAWTGRLAAGGYCGNQQIVNLRGQFGERSVASGDWSSNPTVKAAVDAAVKQGFALLATKINQAVYAELTGSLAPSLRQATGAAQAWKTGTRFALTSLANNNPGVTALLEGESPLVTADTISAQMREQLASTEPGTKRFDVATKALDRAQALQNYIKAHQARIAAGEVSDGDLELNSLSLYLQMQAVNQ